MRIVITGADGFIGRNLSVRLGELGHMDIARITLDSSDEDLKAALKGAEFVFHLAGINRPKDVSEFATGNAGLTETVCNLLAEYGNKAPVVLSSSTQAALDNPYGQSKRAAEDVVFAHGEKTGAPAYVFRLTNVFGKWSQPNYNSAVATFCHNIARGLPIQVNDPAAAVTLVYVDDVVERFIQLMDGADAALDAEGFATVTPQYTTTVGEMAGLIEAFRASRDTLVTERVGTGLVRALYSTYVSYLPPESFAYTVPMHGDARGVFVEMLKTPDCGQFSFFTAHPGITRGGHYHHSKTEKFLVIKGRARYRFRHLLTDEAFEVDSHGDEPLVVETIPGWAHDITNIGDDELVVMLWANEIFDRQQPDTVASKV